MLIQTDATRWEKKQTKKQQTNKNFIKAHKDESKIVLTALNAL